MIGALLPDSVVAVEAFGEEGVREFGSAPLYPQEEVLVARAVAKRRREFTVVRSCARRAMEKLGVPAQPVLPGERGAPQWPDGLTGSMTHCEGYCAAALVRAADLASLGIDAEPHEPLPEGVLSAVALPAEAERLGRLAAGHPEVHWDRLLFSAKEAVYKAWFPLTRKWLDFSEADIDLGPATGTASASVATPVSASGPAEGTEGVFRARLLVPGPVVGGHRLGHFDGRWSVRRGLLATAVTVHHG
ncbi:MULTISPECIES: 4'-phosphopantetheinyl transferase [unclassified Streptomyces]|uniref:4'-phosphopantetheinyl transferase family protein n=1 Tax=unclassified Streptomyces TaxID=2593676 RepID=UPI00070C4187|nr:4'-phosphopantetheinyl transferase superfamily protein [Streptomyces sp. Root1310]KQX78527.1 4'-phosphopantetheinyl transferase [Streptomyces sp. Root1310]